MPGQEISGIIRKNFQPDADGSLIFVPDIMHVTGPATSNPDPNNVYYNPQEDVYIQDDICCRGNQRNYWCMAGIGI